MNGIMSFALVSTVVIGFAAEAAGQAVTMKLTCQNLGPPAVESFGAQPGHAIRETPYSCLVSGGPLDGGVITAKNWWEMKGTEWTLLTGSGAIRRPEGFAVYQNMEGKLTVQMKDGKPSGYTASGHGRYLAASGPAVQLTGKNYNWTVTGTGPTSFQADIEVTGQ